MSRINCISISGGKDSTATALLALEHQPPEDLRFLFCDTGHEHELTYAYLGYLENKLDIHIEKLTASFDKQMQTKKKYILDNWADEGVPQEWVDSAADLLDNPTGIPFLDLCILKSIFPSRRMRFCTTYLKIYPLEKYQHALVDEGAWVWAWNGVRRDESAARANLSMFEDMGNDVLKYRPILNWTAEEAFALAKRHGLMPNRLYQMGMSRVGCMPCIYARKSEIAEISRRFPEVADKIEHWEHLVSAASKHGYATFFQTRSRKGGQTSEEMYQSANIRQTIAWAKTARGGQQFNLELEDDSCSSVYGLCE